MNEIILPIVTLVGQKNAGKSTLFNRLTCTSNALVSNSSGLTRDRQYGIVYYKQFQFMLADTGGFNRFIDTCVQKKINHQTILAIKESCLILFVINNKCTETSVDYDTINYLRKLNKKIFVVINNIDNCTLYDKNFKVWDYYCYGIKNVIVVSAIDGYGINNLLRKIFSKILKKSSFNTNKKCFNLNINRAFYNKKKIVELSQNPDSPVELAVVGRPNSGKSTFVNYVLQSNRVITSNDPGTTRDSIYIPAFYNERHYILVDTAGVRKKNKINGDILERISSVETLKVVKNTHITLFMIDVTEGIVDQDLSLLNFILNNSKSLIIVINKCDLFSSMTLSKKNFLQLLIKKIRFLNFIQVHFISSLYGYGIQNLFKSVREIYEFSIKTIRTAQLNRIMQEAIKKYPPSFLKGTHFTPKLKYVHIREYDPITIVIHGTQVSRLSNEYQKYLKKYFYQSLNMHGVLFRIRFQDTINPFIYKCKKR